MFDIFFKADKDGSGALSFEEFFQCCKDADIGLTKREINILSFQVDQDGDGQISYKEFAPLCYEMLVEILTQQLVEENRTPTMVEELLLESFARKDINQVGRLDPFELKDVLVKCDFGLSKLQLHSVLSEAVYDQDGYAEYSKFAPKAASLIYKLTDNQAVMERRNQVQALEEDFSTLHGAVEEEWRKALTDACYSVDAQQTGFLSLEDLAKALRLCSLELSEYEINSLLSAADYDIDNGMVYYAPLLDYAFHILQYLAQCAAVEFCA